MTSLMHLLRQHHAHHMSTPCTQVKTRLLAHAWRGTLLPSANPCTCPSGLSGQPDPSLWPLARCKASVRSPPDCRSSTLARAKHRQSTCLQQKYSRWRMVFSGPIGLCALEAGDAESKMAKALCGPRSVRGAWLAAGLHVAARESGLVLMIPVPRE
jgi:hypothetical protein